MATHRRSAEGHLIRVRTRASSRLPNFFDKNALVDARDARFDRMVFKRDYLLTNVPTEYDEPGELAVMIADMRAIAGGGALAPQCEAFVLKPNGSRGSSIEVSRNNTAGSATWLIGLALQFRHVGPRRVSGGDNAACPPTQMRAELSLNPTRLAAHAYLRGVEMEAASWRDVLTSDPNTYQMLVNESASLRHDNLLPAHALYPVVQEESAVQILQPVALEESVAHVIHGLRAVEDLIEHLVGCRVADRRWLAAQHPWIIRQSETYWEFGQVNAIETVRRLRPTLWTLSKGSGEREWSLEDGTELLSFKSQLTEAVGIAMYPKTVDRIRLEIRHWKDIPGSATNMSAETRLRAIAANAAQRANRARRAIHDALDTRERDVLTPDALISRLSELTMHLQSAYPQRPDRAADILEKLLTRGGLWCSGDEALVPVAEAQALKRRGVVESAKIGHQSSREPNFPLAPKYRPLFEVFSPVGQEQDAVQDWG